jgi:hypothetical protein
MTHLTNIRNFLSLIDREVDGLEFSSEDRNRISGALFDIVHEHGKSIVILFEQSMVSSAYALVRPMFEAFVRAVWLKHSASDQHIDIIIKKDKFPLNFAQMLKIVEEDQKWPDTLTQIKETVWKSLHSYTHGGLQIISRRITDDYIEHIPNEQEIFSIIQFIALLSFLTFNEIVRMANTSEKNDVIKSMYEWLCRWCFSN